MAAITTLAVTAAGSAYAAHQGAKGAKDAARTQARGYEAATAEQRRQFDAMMALTAPRRQVEGQALDQLAALTGLRGSGGSEPGPIDPTTGLPMGGQQLQPGGPDYSAFFNSPDYQFALQEGEQAALRGASAMGNLRSGNTLAALQARGQGLATQNFNQYVQRLQSLAGMGATDQAANAMLQQGDRAANNLTGAANARASGVAGAANQWQNFGNNIAQLGGYASQRWGSSPKQAPTATPPYAGYRQPAQYMGGYNA